MAHRAVPGQKESPFTSQKGKDEKQQQEGWQEPTAISLLSQHIMGQGSSFLPVSMHYA